MQDSAMFEDHIKLCFKCHHLMFSMIFQYSLDMLLLGILEA